MSFTKESAVEKAKQDLAQRLGVSESDIEASVTDVEFSDMALGAPADGEMAAQMITSGWRIDLSANGEKYEYRAQKYGELRLRDFNGTNYIIES
jgi:hypothetical protein